MGCSVSKLEPDDEAPAGLPLPPRRRLIYRRRPNGCLRKDSIVSTTELLRADDSEAGDDASSQDHEPHAVEKVAVVLPSVAEDVAKPPGCEPKEREPEDDERRKIGFRLGSKSRRMVVEDEELPGSPSFRFYFEFPVQGHPDGFNEDGPVKAEGKLEKTKGEDDSHVLKDGTESLILIKEDKSSKKDRGGRFRALTKGPCTVYGLLNCRNSSGGHPPASSRVSHDLLSENAEKNLS